MFQLPARALVIAADQAEVQSTLQRSINEDAPSPTVSLERSDLHRFFSTSFTTGIRRLLHPVHHGGSGMATGRAHKIHQSQVPLSS